MFKRSFQTRWVLGNKRVMKMVLETLSIVGALFVLGGLPLFDLIASTLKMLGYGTISDRFKDEEKLHVHTVRQ